MPPAVTHFAQGGRALCGSAGATTTITTAVTCTKCRTQLQSNSDRPTPFGMTNR